MAPKSVELSRFGGLNLTADPEEVSLGGAIDGLNTLLDRDGRLRSRDGYASFAALSSNPLMLVKPAYGMTSGAVLYALANSGADLRFARITQAGVVVQGTHALEAASNAWLTTAGSGSTALQVTFYTSDQTGAAATIHWESNTGGTWGGAGSFGPAGGGPLGVTPVDARLIQAANSRVKFSDAGDPFTFGANNYVDVSPGDGQKVLEIVTWRDLVFVFKQTKFFVFYGNTVDGSGNPIFNYRTVNTGQGVKSSGGAVATAEGVYFANDAGVWLTTGSEPHRVSGPVDDLFSRLTLPYTSSTVTNIIANGTVLRVAAARRMLYVFTGAGTLAYDRATRAWTAHDLTALVGCGWSTTSSSPVLDGQEDLFLAKSADSNIYKMSSAATTDAGVAISSRYRTGFWSPGAPGAEAWVREILLEGSGAVTVKTAVNDNATLGTGQAVTLGTAPAVAQGRDRRGLRGRNVSYEFSGSAAWSLSSVVPIVWGQRTAGEQAA